MTSVSDKAKVESLFTGKFLRTRLFSTLFTNSTKRFLLPREAGAARLVNFYPKLGIIKWKSRTFCQSTTKCLVNEEENI